MAPLEPFNLAHPWQHVRCANCQGSLDFRATTLLPLPALSPSPLPFGSVWVLSCGHLVDTACAYHLMRVPYRLRLVHRPGDPPQKVPMTKLWKCPDPHCPATYSSIHSTVSGQFTMDAAYLHDMVPFALGFQEIGQVWGPVTRTPLSTLDKGGKGLRHLLDLHDVLVPRRRLRGIHVTWDLMKNFHVRNPPPLEWSMDEKSLLPLIIAEDSDEEDNQDSHDLVDKSSGPSLRHTAELPVDGGVLVVAAAAVHLGAGLREDIRQQSAGPSVPVASVASPEITPGNIQLGITFQEWCKEWETSYDSHT